MPIYVYKAFTSGGQELTRELTAPNEEELIRELQNQGLLVKHVSQKKTFFFSFQNQSVKPQDFLQCNQEIITLLKAGLTVPEVLDLVSDRPDSPRLTAVLKRILEDVKKGTQLSDACVKYPGIFDGLYLSSLRTGERTGQLAIPLGRYQEYLTQKVALQSKVSMAMVYPLFLLGVLITILGFLFTFVMPRFAALYSDFNAQLPLPTRILIVLVNHLSLVAIVLGGCGFLIWASWKTWTATQKGRVWIDESKQRLPLVSQFTRPFMISQLARTLSTLLSGGTSLMEALKVTRESLTNQFYSVKMDCVIQRVLDGESLSSAMHSEKLMPRSAVKLIEVAEASGQLEQMLQEIARSHELVLESRVQKAMTLIEPIFILLAGLLIGTVIVVMYLPIMHLSDIVK